MEENLEWLDEEYLKLLLKSSVEECTNKEDLTIEDYKATRAVEKGKNFSSTIYRLQVLYKHNSDDVKKKTYIIKKIIPTVGDWLTDKETEIYKIIPKIEKYVNSKYAPMCYFSKDKSMVMEDLGEQGFENTKVKPLDYDHCQLALTALAKFHAGSVLLHQQDPILVEETLGRELFTNNSNFDFVEFFEKSINALGEEISTWPESKQYAKYMPTIANSLRGYFENLFKRDGLKVLNHGDFHLHNMMFRYDSDKVCEVRLVDFQICRFAPPTCDLQYFFGASGDLDVRQNRRDDLLSVYLKTLNDTLADIGISRSITKHQFEDDFKKDYVMYFMSVCGLGIVLADSEDSFTVEDVSHDVDKEMSDKFIGMMKGRKFREFVPTVLDDLDKRGVFQRQQVTIETL